MEEVDELEEAAEILQQRLRSSSEVEDSTVGDAAQLRDLLERLERKRNELTRISNACRRPHSNV
jgi:hypothetical protein